MGGCDIAYYENTRERVPSWDTANLAVWPHREEAFLRHKRQTGASPCGETVAQHSGNASDLRNAKLAETRTSESTQLKIDASTPLPTIRGCPCCHQLPSPSTKSSVPSVLPSHPNGAQYRRSGTALAITVRVTSPSSSTACGPLCDLAILSTCLLFPINNSPTLLLLSTYHVQSTQPPCSLAESSSILSVIYSPVPQSVNSELPLSV